MHKPSWFSDSHVMVSTAPTCGLSKKGRIRRKIDPATGERRRVLDPDTGALVDQVDDKLLEDMKELNESVGNVENVNGEGSDTLRFVPNDLVEMRAAVPSYYDKRLLKHFWAELEKPFFAGFETKTIGQLKSEGKVEIRNGHGSPSQEERVGDVPYIKVSDLRAGLVNINPTNRVPRAVAKRFWRGESSGLQAFDIICPERTSKNIGDFCMLLPGQEQVMCTKEVIVLRPGPAADFDAFYLLWAMTLKVVRDQWNRVIFMQTNREDVGKRYLEIEIPVPPSRDKADEVSAQFREYYQTLASARERMQEYLATSENVHHFFVGAAAEVPAEVADD
jgi:type I restriction enzyme M protein